MVRPIAMLQVNLGRDKGATDLLEQVVVEKDIDIVVVAEPNVNYVRRRKWIVDVAVWVRSSMVKVKGVGQGQGYVWIVVEDIFVCGCYFSPNRDLDKFDAFLGAVGEDCRRKGGRKCVCEILAVGITNRLPKRAIDGGVPHRKRDGRNKWRRSHVC